MKWIVLALSFFSLNHLSAQVAPRLDWPHGVGKMSSASGDFRDIGIDLDVLGNRHAAVTAEVQADVDPRPDETIHAGAGRSPVSSGKDMHFTAVATYRSGKPPLVPHAPTGLVATAGVNAAHIAFTAPTSAGLSAISNYEYKLNDDSWVALSPARTTSPLTISGLTACNTYTIRIRAVNASGGGSASDSVVVTPLGGQSAGISWTTHATVEDRSWSAMTYANDKFVAIAYGKTMTSTDGVNWTTPVDGVSGTWRGVTYGNGLFVAVGDYGPNRVMTSPDGINWTVGSPAEQNDWHSVTYGNGLFVAVATRGTNRVMTSPDGITWTASSATEQNDWYSVTYGNGLFVAVSGNGTNRVMTSPDGINWTASSAAEQNSWMSVTYGNGLFVAVSFDGTNRVMTSPDGITWTARAAAEAKYWYSVTYGNGLFVSVGEGSGTNLVMTSPDGNTWTARSATNGVWMIVTYGNRKFVALADEDTNVITSSDFFTPGSPVISGITPGGTTASVAFTAPANAGSSAITNYEYSVDNGSNWVTPSPATTTSPLSITGLSGGTSYAVKLRAVNTGGAGCATAVSSVTTMSTANAATGLVATAGYNAAHIAFTAPTNDGGSAIINYEYKLNDSAWVALSPARTGSALTISGLTACNTYTIRIRAVTAAGGGTASDSVLVTPQGGLPAGVSWTGYAASEQSTWNSVTYGNGLYVAISTNGTNQLMTSPDGITWTARSAAETNAWQSVTYGNGLFVAVANAGTNRVMTSPDGITWTPRTAAAQNTWWFVTYENGLFVALSYSGTNQVMTSPDGINWTARAHVGGSVWNSVSYGNGLFVGVATTGTSRVMTSPDGITWTARSAAEQNLWNSVTYGNGLFVAVSGGGTNRVMTSPDGITWTARSATEANRWLSVSYGNGLFVALSNDGTNRLMISLDGITWISRSASEANSWKSIVYGNGKFVAVSVSGTNRVMTSSDLLTPGSPVISGITPGGTTASVAFTAPANAGSSAITNYEYSVDNGSNWVTPSPATTTSPLSITGLTGGTSYAVKLRAVNTGGVGCATAVSSVTTMSTANAATGLVATAGYNAAHIAFTAPTNDGGSAIINYEYKLNDSSWVALSPARTGSALTISGLTACNTYTIRIRAVTAAGGGTASDSVVVTPLGGQSAGISWTTHATVEDEAWITTFANDKFVAVTGGKTMTSPDGVNWTTPVAAPAANWMNITYGNGIFVAVSNNGTNRVMTSPDGITWTARAAAEQNGWSSVTYGNGLFVAVSNNGTNRVMTSPDGVTWTARSAAESNVWNSVSYGNGLFVGVATTGTSRVMTSPDGITWTARSAAEQNLWNSVTYGNGLFVAVAGSGTNRVMTSPDGITWTARSAAASNFWESVTFGNGLFAAVSEDGTQRVMTSPDGITWTGRSAPSGPWYRLTYGNGKFVVVGYEGTNVMTSSDLLTPGSPVISGITPGGTTASVAFTAPANGGSSAITNYEYSVDNGSNWVTPSPATTTSPLSITGLTGGTSYAVKLRAVNTEGAGCATAVNSISTVLPANEPTGLVATAGYNAAHIAFTPPTNNGGGAIFNYEYKLNDSAWVALSPAKTVSPLTISGLTACNTYTIRIRAVNGAGVGTASDSVVVTPQGGQPAGISWTTHATVENRLWNGVTYANGKYVAVGFEKTMMSTDGITWTTGSTAEANIWTSVTYGNGLFVAVSASGTNMVMTSPDGINWTPRTAAVNYSWYSVTYGNGMFVAVGAHDMTMTSPDGINWTSHAATEANFWTSVTYGNGLFVAVSSDGTNKVMTSPDGFTWTARSAAEQNAWYSVTYGNGLFVAVSGDGTNRVMTSPDGITWTPRSAAEANLWTSVTFGNGLFTAVTDGGTHQVMTSPDGITWTGRSVASGPWYTTTYGNGKFVALGWEGTNMLTSSDLLTPGSPVISGITPGGTTASVAFTAPANTGSSAITNYEYSVDNGSNWVTPSPATTTSPLSITGLSGGTSYAVKLRAVNTQGAGCATAVDSIMSSCINPTNGGTIAAAQSGAAPFNPAAFTSTTAASGASGTLEYKWQSSTTDSSSGFSDIASSNSATYDPGALSQTTWFKRLARVSCQADWTGAVQSNVLKVTVSKAWIGGNGNWNVGANWSNGLVPVTSDLLTISSGNPQLNVDYEIGGSLTISGTGSLTVNAGKTLTVSGTADFGGKSVVFRSNASATAQLGVVSGTLINDDNVTVERFIPNTGRRWRFLTAPVDGVTINQAWQNGQTWNGTAALTGDTTGTLITGKQQGNATSANSRGFDFWSAISNSSSSLQTYSQRAGQGTWVDLGNTLSSNAFNSSQGYLVFIRGPRSSSYTSASSTASTTLRPTGKLRQGTISIRVDGSKGFTVVGNPYASQIDFDAVYSNSGNSALIKRQIWVWDATRGVSGDFQAVMYSEGKYIEVPAKFHASGQASPLTAIQSGQAFMLVPQSGSSGYLTIRESNKIMAMPSTPNLLLGTNKTPRIYLNLMRRESTGETMLSDGIMVAYRSGYRMETTDEDDMLKFNNLGDNIAVQNSGTNLIADARPLTDMGTPIALNMWNLSGSSYRFEVKMEGMPASEWEAYLEDLELKTRSALSMQGDITSVDWQMLANGSTAPSERFRIVFERKAVRATPTPEELEEAQSIRVYPNPVTGRQFTVRLSQLPSDVYTLQLYSIDGRMVMNKRINHENGTGQYKLDLESTLPKGTYQLRCLKGQEAVSITKLVIQ